MSLGTVWLTQKLFSSTTISSCIILKLLYLFLFVNQIKFFDFLFSFQSLTPKFVFSPGQSFFYFQKPGFIRCDILFVRKNVCSLNTKTKTNRYTYMVIIYFRGPLFEKETSSFISKRLQKAFFSASTSKFELIIQSPIKIN